MSIIRNPALICLVSPPQRAYNHYRPPVALMYLAAYLEKKGITAEIIDPKFDQPVSPELTEGIKQKILDEIKRKKPVFVGIGCYTNEYPEVMDVAKRIKQLDPGIIIISGGVHPTLRPEEMLFTGSPIDYVVIGEGEVTLYELIETLRNNRPLNAVSGIAYFDRVKNIFVRTQPRCLVNNLDDLPFPAFNKIDMAHYTLPNPYAVRGIFLSTFYILITRGCPSNCTFCVNKNLRKYTGTGEYFRYRSAENVLAELALLKEKYKIDAFYIIDDAFTLNKSLVEEICRGMIERKMHLLWGCSTKISAVTRELLELMKKAGCVQIDFGVESGSDEVLRRMKKGINVAQIKKAFRLCSEAGIRKFANILVNFPGETDEDIRQTLQVLDEIRPDVTSFNIFIPFLGTDIYEDYKFNLKPEEYAVLGKPPFELIREKRFIFAKHGIDFRKFYTENHKKYNHVNNFAASHFTKNYAMTLLRSRRKIEYLKQFSGLIKELALQLNVR